MSRETALARYYAWLDTPARNHHDACPDKAAQTWLERFRATGGEVMDPDVPAWTREDTVNRLAAWEAVAGTLPARRQANRIEALLGFTRDELQRARRYYGL